MYTVRPRHTYTIQALRFVNSSIRKSISNNKKSLFRPVELFEENITWFPSDLHLPPMSIASRVRSGGVNVTMSAYSQPETKLYRVLLHRITSLADCRFDISHSFRTSSFLPFIFLYHLHIQIRQRAELIYPDRSLVTNQDVVVSSCLLQMWQHRPLRWFVGPSPSSQLEYRLSIFVQSGEISRLTGTEVCSSAERLCYNCEYLYPRIVVLLRNSADLLESI